MKDYSKEAQQDLLNHKREPFLPHTLLDVLECIMCGLFIGWLVFQWVTA